MSSVETADTLGSGVLVSPVDLLSKGIYPFVREGSSYTFSLTQS